MRRHPLSQLNLPSFSTTPFEQWEQPETLVTLKHLSQNLSYLQQQYHKKILPRHNNPIKVRPKHMSVPIRQNQQRENQELPRILSSYEVVDFKTKRSKRSISAVKQISEQTPREQEGMSARRVVKQFSQMRGLFPLHNRHGELFLHKHKKMNISRALNLNRRKNKTSHRLFYQRIQNQLNRDQNCPMSPSRLGVRLLC